MPASRITLLQRSVSSFLRRAKIGLALNAAFASPSIAKRGLLEGPTGSTSSDRQETIVAASCGIPMLERPRTEQ